MTNRTDLPAEPPSSDDARLACGRLLSQAWEAGPDDAHTLSCPHCTRATGELRSLEAAVVELRDDPPGMTGHDPDALTRRVMDIVRMELRPGSPLPFGDPHEDLWIVEAAAARSLRAAAETVPGVRAGSCRLKPGTEEDPRGIEVRLDIHASASRPLPAVAEQVRVHVLEAASRQLGLGVTHVDIRITDLTPGAPPDNSPVDAPDDIPDDIPDDNPVDAPDDIPDEEEAGA